MLLVTLCWVVVATSSSKIFVILAEEQQMRELRFGVNYLYGILGLVLPGRSQLLVLCYFQFCCVFFKCSCSSSGLPGFLGATEHYCVSFQTVMLKSSFGLAYVLKESSLKPMSAWATAFIYCDVLSIHLWKFKYRLQPSGTIDVKNSKIVITAIS